MRDDVATAARTDRLLTRKTGFLWLALVLALGLPAACTPTYVLDVTVDFDAGTFAGSSVVTVENEMATLLDHLCFRLFPNAYAIYGTAAVSVLEVSVDGSATSFVTDQDETVLVVPLSRSLDLGEVIELRFVFEGSAAIHTEADWPAEEYGLMTRTGSTMTLSAFYPLLAPYTDEGWAIDPVTTYGDAVMADASEYFVTLTAPSDVSAYATGRRIGAVAEDGTAVYSFSATAARDFAIVLVESVVESERSVDGITLRAAFLPQHSSAVAVALDCAEDAVRLFGERIGPLPYEEIDIVDVPMFRAAGMEFSGLILVASAYSATPNDPFFSVIVSHELAHQWFYAAVGNDVSEAPWLDEGFATYLSYVYLENAFADGIGTLYLDSWRQSFERARTSYPDCTITTPAHAFPNAEAYRVFVYDGAALFWHAVRSALGDEGFYALLKAYYQSYAGRIASTDNMIDVLLSTQDPAVLDAMIDYGVLHP